MQYHCLEFNQLSAQQLHDILKLRSDVFLLEQHCSYDIDGADPKALHFFGEEEGEILAYLRFFLPEPDQNILVFGRVVVANSGRGRGYGKQLMRAFLHHCETIYPQMPVFCSAQAHLEKFYADFGFKVCGEGYLEENIPHLPMILTPRAILGPEDAV